MNGPPLTRDVSVVALAVILVLAPSAVVALAVIAHALDHPSVCAVLVTKENEK